MWGPSAWTAKTSIEDAANFTPRAKRVFASARKEAHRLRHNFIGTEHVLLGLISLGDGVAANVLIKFGLDLESARAKIEELVGFGPEGKTLIHFAYTPRIKQVVGLANQEAETLHNTYVGTEHLLLAIIAEGNGVAARAMRQSKIDLKEMRKFILDEITPKSS